MRWLLPICAALVVTVPALAAAPENPVYSAPPAGFIAARGERSLIMGYPGSLEIWAYPLQLLSGYRLRFQVPGQVAAIAGETLLQRVEHGPAETIRIYIGPDFVVREHLFVPRREAAVIIGYEVEGRSDVRIEAGFNPSLDLMWPGALGGQSIEWDASIGGYLEREPLHNFAATVTSPEMVAHDATPNRARPMGDTISLVLAPRGAAGTARTATLVVTGKAATAADLASLSARAGSLREEATAHAAAVTASAIEITTPDLAVNRALASAVLMLDQAWVCSDALGCGMVAGYGPSRPRRRPQYAWFFAGDGLVATEGLLAVGEYGRAREELAFIARYQSAKTGMIWHEISQSAPLLDWERRYPYMFVHVDISFQYLATVADYVASSGDRRFALDHWRGLAAAWRYCTSLLDSGSGLPRIPAGKQGQNEQDRLRDDIRLSTLWIDAAGGFARLAQSTGHVRDAVSATAMASRARRSLAADGWDEARGFWLSGHTITGAAVHDERPDASGALTQDVFTADRVDRVLDRLAAPEFQTDWGIRSLSANAPGYDPNLYGSGSVWALGTASVATTFWRSHRPLNGWSLWRSLIAWNTLDSPGHLHEALAGDLFHPELESVPEQTWSSASLLSSAVQGLLGLTVWGGEHRIGFAPHLPADWPAVTVRNVVIGDARLDLRLTRDAHGVDLQVDNRGGNTTVSFAPEIMLGARVIGASVDGVRSDVQIEHHARDSHALMSFTAKNGRTRVHVDTTGGLMLSVPAPPPAVGDASNALKIGRAVFDDKTLTVAAWVTSAARARVIISTPWQPSAVSGARITPLGNDRYQLQFDLPPDSLVSPGAYRPVSAVIHVRDPDRK